MLALAAAFARAPAARAQDQPVVAPAAPAVEEPPADEPVVVEVAVVGSRTEAERLQQSAQAVTVVDMRKAKQRSADLGEVLSRTQGVTVRRDGGLGSETDLSLNGLRGDQVRFFLDGVPLDLAGYPLGFANVPVNLVDRIEVYRGVVPIRFGADALGGAINLVTDQIYERHAGWSYQAGSFGTRRITADGRYRDEETSVVAGGEVYFDIADNDYEVDVEIQGEPATVPRFHDDYRGYGVALEAGVVERPWAERLLLRAYASSYDKELQHNVVMTVPYGEVTYAETVYGATARYEVSLSADVTLELVGSFAHRIIDYFDMSAQSYDWYGRRRAVTGIQRPGERGDRGSDRRVWQNSGFGRAVASWSVAPEHVLRASVTPSFTTRTGDERFQVSTTARDPLTAQRDLFTFVSGLEYELSVLDDRVSNIVFAKDYFYDARSEEPVTAAIYRQLDTQRHRQGAGDALRIRITPWLYAKASYEYATRLPRADEVFGNAMLIEPNLELRPEVSHNVNVGPRLELERTPLGDFTVDVNGFVRDSADLIILLGTADSFSYQNVYEARSVGLENALNWVSPGRYVSLDGTLTYQDVRNTSTDGAFGDHEGKRIPNQPSVFGSWGLSLRFSGMPEKRDTLEPFYAGRYVHEFFRTWEGVGRRDLKDTIDTQVTHTLGISWIASRDWGRITTTAELDNVADAKVFDNFGVQRPGRAFYFKLTGEI